MSHDHDPHGLGHDHAERGGHDHAEHDHAHPHPHPHVDPAPGAAGGRPGLDRALRIGVGGPVGSGKTTLVGALCTLLRDRLGLAVVTNDIFTTEDAEALRRAGVLPTERIVAVETGCCPHTAIRDDIAANLDAAEDLEAALGDVEITLIESGGDNLTAVFSRGLVDVQIFVLDTAGGDDVPRKGGPGVATADLLVINKVDLAPHVGADTARMASDAAERRAGGPVLLTSLRTPEGAEPVASWVIDQLTRVRLQGAVAGR
jgi:urease accessory protein